MFFCGENATRSVQLMQLQLELKKTVEIMYLEANKQQTTYQVKYLKVWK